MNQRTWAQPTPILLLLFSFKYIPKPVYKFEVVFHFKKVRSPSIVKTLRSSSISQILRLSSILKEIDVVYHLQKMQVFFHFQKNEVVFQSKQDIEVVFHITSSWVETMLHTNNQLLRLPRAKLRLSSIWKQIEVVFHFQKY